MLMVARRRPSMAPNGTMTSFADGTVFIQAAPTKACASHSSRLSKAERSKLREPRALANQELAIEAEAAALSRERQYIIKNNVAPHEVEVSTSVSLQTHESHVSEGAPRSMTACVAFCSACSTVRIFMNVNRTKEAVTMLVWPELNSRLNCLLCNFDVLPLTACILMVQYWTMRIGCRICGISTLVKLT
jgi:hypothetical protein